MTEADKNQADDRGLLIDDTQQLHEGFRESDIFKEYLRRSKLKSSDLPSRNNNASTPSKDSHKD